ncbi:hypothetical protein HDU89_003184 [Geranomyces variabilis]|nr:hypothetical protein HDU89_003184 [Geranomyces variabilis]
MAYPFNQYVDTVSALKRYKNQPDALLLLQWLVVQVKPIMKAHGWHVPIVREFFPRDDRLLGQNRNRGAEILIRLRPAHAPDTFYPTPDLIHTMLHELTHNVYSAHNAVFFRFLDGLRDEYDALRAKGWKGEGFLAPGQRLGVGAAAGNGFVHNPPEHVARRLAVEAAEKRGKVARVMLPAGGRKLGGPTRFEMLGKTPQQMAAYYAERRAMDNIWCGETHADDDGGETPQSKAAGGKDELSAESQGVPTMTFADFGSAENPIVIGDEDDEPFPFQGQSSSSSSSSSPAAASASYSSSSSKLIIKQEEGQPVVLIVSDEDEPLVQSRPTSSAASGIPVILAPRKRPSSSASSSSPSSSRSNPPPPRSPATPKRPSASSSSSPSSSTRKKSRTSPLSSSLPSSTLLLPAQTPPRRHGFFNTMLSPSPSRNVKPSSVTRTTYGDWSPPESHDRAAPRVDGGSSSSGSAAAASSCRSSSSLLPARKLNFGPALGNGGSSAGLSARIPPPSPPCNNNAASQQQPAQHWACQICTFENENPIALACYACGSAWANNDDDSAVAVAAALLQEEQDEKRRRQRQQEQERPQSDADEQWQCPKCTKLTSTRYRLCMLCHYMRPPE